MLDTALILVDLQNDFLSTEGSLYVEPGVLQLDNLTPQINYIRKLLVQHSWGAVVATRDWHPFNHCSFVGNPNERSATKAGVWPIHCVASTWSADLVNYLPQRRINMILNKGTRQNVDSYSAFYEEDGADTGLTAYLQAKGITRISIVGVATEICIRATAIDSLKNFETTILTAGCWSLEEETGKATLKELETAGARLLS